MKRSLYLVVAFICIVSCKPHELMKVSLEDKSDMMVEGKFDGEYFSFRHSDKEAPKKLHYSAIDYVEKKDFSGDLAKFKYLKIVNTDKYKLLKEKIAGPVSLYTKTFVGTSPSLPGMGVGIPGTPFAVGVAYSKKVVKSYVTGKNSDKAVLLSSKKILKQVGPSFFKDCPELVQKIKSEEYTDEDVEKMVIFYNYNCSTNE